MEQRATSSTVKVWFHKGRREYAFPRLPDALDLESRKALCDNWCKAELVSRGICVSSKVYEDGQVVFWTTTRRLDPLEETGFGERVEAWARLTSSRRSSLRLRAP